MSVSSEPSFLNDDSVGSLSDYDDFLPDPDDDEPRADRDVRRALESLREDDRDVAWCFRGDGVVGRGRRGLSLDAAASLGAHLRTRRPGGSLAFVRADLSGAPLGALASAARLAEPGASALTRATFYRCGLGPSDAETLAAYLGADANLQYLNLRGNGGLGSEGTRMIAASLRQHPRIRDVDLAEADMDDAGAAAIADLLRDSATIECLDLSENAISCDGAEALASALLLHRGADLSLHLSGNSIGDRGGRNLAAALREKEARSISTLFLRRNDMGDAGLSALLESVYDDTSLNAMSDRNHSLGRLCLDENSDVSEGMERRAYTILRWLETSAGLDLEEERECEDPAKRWSARRGKKILALLLDNFNISYFDDLGVATMPFAIEKIILFGGDLNFAYGILRNWKMPTLFEDSKSE